VLPPRQPSSSGAVRESRNAHFSYSTRKLLIPMTRNGDFSRFSKSTTGTIPRRVFSKELAPARKGPLESSPQIVRQVSRLFSMNLNGRRPTKRTSDRGLSLPTAWPINDGKAPPPGGPSVFFQNLLCPRFRGLPDKPPGRAAGEQQPISSPIPWPCSITRPRPASG